MAGVGSYWCIQSLPNALGPQSSLWHHHRILTSTTDACCLFALPCVVLWCVCVLFCLVSLHHSRLLDVTALLTFVQFVCVMFANLCRDVFLQHSQSYVCPFVLCYVLSSQSSLCNHLIPGRSLLLLVAIAVAISSSNASASACACGLTFSPPTIVHPIPSTATHTCAVFPIGVACTHCGPQPSS